MPYRRARLILIFMNQVSLLDVHSETYQRHVLDVSPEWQQIRSVAMLRAGGRCEFCEYYGQGLSTAHLTYERLGAERLDDLAVLCSADHQLLDRGPARARMVLRMITQRWRPAAPPGIAALAEVLPQPQPPTLQLTAA